MDSWVADTLLFGLVVWYSGHSVVIQTTLKQISKGLNLMSKVYTFTHAALFSASIMLSEALAQGLPRKATKDESGKIVQPSWLYKNKQNYHLMASVENLSDESAIAQWRDCESILAELWKCKTALTGEHKTERIVQLQGLARAEYQTSGRLPQWIDSMLANGNLDAVETTKTPKGKKTNTLATVPVIGSAVITESHENSVKPLPTNKPTTTTTNALESPLTQGTSYTLAGIAMVARRMTPDGQIFQCSDDVTARRLKPTTAFYLDDVNGYKWVVVKRDSDAGIIYATPHKTHVTPTTTTTTTKRKGKATPTTTTPTKAEVLAKVMSMLAALED